MAARHAQDDAAGRDERHLVPGRHDPRGDDGPRPLRRQVHHLDPLPIAPLAAILRQRRALAIPLLGDDQQVGVVAGHIGPGQRVPRIEAHGVDARRRPAHRPHVLLVEANALTLLADEDDVLLAACHLHPAQAVARLQVDGDQPARPHAGEHTQLHPLDAPLAGDHDQVLALVEVVDGQRGGDLLLRR